MNTADPLIGITEHPQEFALPIYAGHIPTFGEVEIRDANAERFVHRVKETWIVSAPSHAADYVYEPVCKFK